MFVLCSDITIGNFRFTGVHEVYVSRSIHSLVDKATIKLPSIARVIKDGKPVQGTLVTGLQFNIGDHVTIKLGYNNDLHTEFEGFVVRRNLNMPLEIECEGYSWLLKRNTINSFHESISIKELLEFAVSGIDKKIEVRCETDMKLINLKVVNESGFQMINNLLKNTDGCLSCFFIEPNVLWCGMAYTGYGKGKSIVANKESIFKLGINTLKENGLKEKTVQLPVSVKYTKKLATGRTITATSAKNKKASIIRSKIINRVDDQKWLKELADEKANRLNFSGYEGYINGFLQPYANPGEDAFIIDKRYPERNGAYLIESVEVTFGIKGARRVVEVGPKKGFINEQ